MSLPPISPLEHLGNRPFSFYPPILNVEHNEWFFRRGTWSEILVVNSRDGQEIWIPRRFLGEISQIEDPVLIVGLVKELEYKAGAVWPHQRRVIQMPVAVGDRPRTPPQPLESPAPVIGIRTQSVTDSRMGKLVGFTLLRGRLFTEFDNEQSPSAVVVNEALAETYWPHEDAIGKHLKLSPRATSWATVGHQLMTTGSPKPAPFSFAACGIRSEGISSS